VILDVSGVVACGGVSHGANSLSGVGLGIAKVIPVGGKIVSTALSPVYPAPGATWRPFIWSSPRLGCRRRWCG